MRRLAPLVCIVENPVQHSSFFFFTSVTPFSLPIIEVVTKNKTNFAFFAYGSVWHGLHYNVLKMLCKGFLDFKAWI